MDNFLKITFIDGKSKFNTYLQNPASGVSNLNAQILFSIFQQRNLQTDEIRIYWIDDDGDQIDILDQQDYEVFRRIRTNGRHIYVERIKKLETEPTSSNNSNEVNRDSVHDKVECDECHVNPIVGFRYKCLECENFDLCASCEAKCLHSHHLMLRISSPLNEHWWAVKDFRKRARRCPASSTVDNEDSNGENASPFRQQNSNGRWANSAKACTRQRGHPNCTWNAFSNLCEMMQHLAEGGANGVNSTVTPLSTPPEERDQTAGVVPPKTPPPTPTNINLPEASSSSGPKFRSETKSKEATTNTSPKATTSQLGSPLLDNVQQFVDPQYMKAGIEILSNFSEMFSKILEPVDGNEANERKKCPFEVLNSFNAAYNNNMNSHTHGQSKSQSTSRSASITNDANSDAISVDSVLKAANQAAQAAATAAVESSVHAATVAATLQASQNNSPDVKAENVATRSTSQDADGDWQMIDKGTPNVSVHDLSVSSNSNLSIAPSTSTPSTNGASGIDYVKLSHDLNKHLENEKKSVGQVETPVETVAAAEAAASAPVIPPAINLPVGKSSAPLTNEEKRAIIVYHKDQRINNAIVAMMAMGFSNEGGWLTQLVESVNGSIPEALDEMSAAQRSRN